MAIEVELPDGTIAEFPDGTDNATMEFALASYRRPSSSRPDFSNVQSGYSVGGKNQPILSARARIAKARAEGEAAAMRADYDRMNAGGSGVQ